MRIGIIVLLILVVLGGGLYWLALDGSTPEGDPYRFPIEEMRALIDNHDAALPEALNVEIVSTDQTPLIAAHAGLHFEPFRLSMTSFQIRGGNGDIIIDGAMDQSLFDENHQSDDAVFSSQAYTRMIDAIAASDATIITHEHIDHIGGISRAPDPTRLAPHLLFSKEQINAISEFTVDGSMPDAYKSLAPADLSAPRLIAPGVVVAPAPGHTAGSQIILVRDQKNQEYLFIGDIVWAMKNIESAWGRPRILQYLFFSPPEDRITVQRQVRGLYRLSENEPGLVILPCHDLDYLRALISAGKIGGQFE